MSMEDHAPKKLFHGKLEMVLCKDFGFTLDLSHLSLKSHDSYTRLRLIPAANHFSFKHNTTPK